MYISSRNKAHTAEDLSVTIAAHFPLSQFALDWARIQHLAFARVKTFSDHFSGIFLRHKSQFVQKCYRPFFTFSVSKVEFLLFFTVFREEKTLFSDILEFSYCFCFST